MKSYAIYNPATGEVLRKARGPERSAEIGLQPGEAIFWGEIDHKTHFLPGGFPALKPVESVTIAPEQIKQWAGRILSYTDWVALRALSGGAPMSPEMTVYRQAVRDRSGEIEAMSPIPADYQDAKYWPEAP